MCIQTAWKNDFDAIQNCIEVDQMLVLYRSVVVGFISRLTLERRHEDRGDGCLSFYKSVLSATLTGCFIVITVLCLR